MREPINTHAPAARGTELVVSSCSRRADQLEEDEVDDLVHVDAGVEHVD
jgi:hypothetical protein